MAEHTKWEEQYNKHLAAQDDNSMTKHLLNYLQTPVAERDELVQDPAVAKSLQVVLHSYAERVATLSETMRKSGGQGMFNKQFLEKAPQVVNDVINEIERLKARSFDQEGPTPGQT